MKRKMQAKCAATGNGCAVRYDSDKHVIEKAPIRTVDVMTMMMYPSVECLSTCESLFGSNR
eukprot:17978-Eustigmatos_ZCMA.PRE.1